MGTKQSIARQGSAAPFILFALGIYVLVTIPDISELTPHKGIIEKYVQIDEKPMYIYLHGEKEPYIVKYWKYKELLTEVINKKNQEIIIWTENIKRKIDLHLTDKKTALQVVIDGKIIFYYTSLSSKIIGWGSIIIGCILIPIVIKLRIKYADEFRK